MKTMNIKDESELPELAMQVIKILQTNKPENVASVLALSGDLGAGKTTFTKVLATELGVAEMVTSPTFVVMRRYETDTTNQKISSFDWLYHIDAYRIEDIDEMRVLRFEEVLAQKDTIICIEWAERIEELLPKHTVYLNIENTGENSRAITIS